MKAEIPSVVEGHVPNRMGPGWKFITSDSIATSACPDFAGFDAGIVKANKTGKTGRSGSIPLFPE
ncbi:MAG: hypothetical protein L0Y74_10505 [candidate division Zixibacteria bacterium]|nr:hypothetical protein [candidate division Zixibacteria bacterium]